MKPIKLKNRAPLCAACLIGMMALSAWADTPPPPPTTPPPPPPPAVVNGACKQDLATFCPNVAPGDGRLRACMRTNYRLLSPACKDAIRANRIDHPQPPPGTPPPPPPPGTAPPSSPPPSSPPPSSAPPSTAPAGSTAPSH